MGYYRELAFALRIRGVSEREIASTLEQVRDHPTGAAEAAVTFGEPVAYAERSVQRVRPTSGKRFVATMTVLAVVVVVTSAVVSRVLDVELRLAGISVPLTVGVLLAVVGLVGGFLLDRRLPRGFRP